MAPQTQSSSHAATVFYSWQSDHSATRSLVRDALVRAAVQLNAALEDSIRVDSDTQGVAGTPAITPTIFRKIDEAAVFVGDVTFVGRGSEPHQGDSRLLPNPNVLLELGYAVARLGWDRIILVSNAHFGPPERLPFDLRSHRFPATFDLNEATERHEVRDKLATELQAYINTCLGARLAAAEDALASLDGYAVELLLHNADGDGWGVNMAFGSGVSASPFDLALAKLLDLRLARLRLDPGQVRRYDWTYLGRETIKLLLQRGVASMRR